MSFGMWDCQDRPDYLSKYTLRLREPFIQGPPPGEELSPFVDYYALAGIPPLEKLRKLIFAPLAVWRGTLVTGVVMSYFLGLNACFLVVRDRGARYKLAVPVTKYYFCGLGGWIMGCRSKVVGLQNLQDVVASGQGFVTVANHVGYYDFLALGRVDCTRQRVKLRQVVQKQRLKGVITGLSTKVAFQKKTRRVPYHALRRPVFVTSEAVSPPPADREVQQHDEQDADGPGLLQKSLHTDISAIEPSVEGGGGAGVPPGSGGGDEGGDGSNGGGNGEENDSQGNKVLLTLHDAWKRSNFLQKFFFGGLFANTLLSLTPSVHRYAQSNPSRSGYLLDHPPPLFVLYSVYSNFQLESVICVTY
eukprot:gene8855-10493_t